MSLSEKLRARWRGGEDRTVLTTLVVAAAAVLVIVVAVLALRPEPVPDFRDWKAGAERKERFFAFMRPLIREENARILEQRERLQSLVAEEDAEEEIGWFDRRWLRGLAEKYGLDPEEAETDALIERLLMRVDIVPVSLALAQAAKESGWGTSRFAREGNNLFGQWCYEPGCGLVPHARGPGRSHEVRVFDSPRASVASYLRNINTHRGYRELRQARARLRAAGRPLSGLALAEQLHRYSERGQAYVEEIKGLIRYNRLEQSGA
ncbi:MAG TPA: glucosaminidase domain-containing protein [Woeseiaceae bacterium]|nr:glucosaminidase domain-containing protein [Woeseiaceae bacterium]